jgi:hypothetical protein
MRAAQSLSWARRPVPAPYAPHPTQRHSGLADHRSPRSQCVLENAVRCFENSTGWFVTRLGGRVGGVRLIAGIVASTLALLLATHLVICPPTFDDDVCAAARIDYAVQFAAEKPAEAAKAPGERPNFLGATLTASLPAASWNPPLAAPAPESSLAMLASPTATRNSALAHRRSVVLIL